MLREAILRNNSNNLACAFVPLLAPAAGFEPATCRLTVGRSAVELRGIADTSVANFPGLCPFCLGSVEICLCSKGFWGKRCRFSALPAVAVRHSRNPPACYTLPNFAASLVQRYWRVSCLREALQRRRGGSGCLTTLACTLWQSAPGTTLSVCPRPDQS